MKILCSFRLVLEGKTGKKIPESSRFEFLEKFLANNIALSDAEDYTSGPLNRGGIADLPLLRTLLAIRQKSELESDLASELESDPQDTAGWGKKRPVDCNAGETQVLFDQSNNTLVILM